MIILWQHQKNMYVRSAEEVLEVQRSLCFNQQENAPKQQMAIILGIRNLKRYITPPFLLCNVELLLCKRGVFIADEIINAYLMRAS